MNNLERVSQVWSELKKETTSLRPGEARQVWEQIKKEKTITLRPALTATEHSASESATPYELFNNKKPIPTVTPLTPSRKKRQIRKKCKRCKTFKPLNDTNWRWNKKHTRYMRHCNDCMSPNAKPPVPRQIVIRIEQSERIKKAGDDGTTYASRDKILMELGYANYNKYLKSSAWRYIKRAAFDKHGRICKLCGYGASVIHHRKYTKEVLCGDDLEPLVPLCDDCHSDIEFSKPKNHRGKRNLKHVEKLFLKKLKHSSFN